MAVTSIFGEEQEVAELASSSSEEFEETVEAVDVSDRQVSTRSSFTISSATDMLGVGISWMWNDSKGTFGMASSTSAISGSTWWLKAASFIGLIPAQRSVASLASCTGMTLQGCAAARPYGRAEEAELIDEARDERDDASEIMDSGEVLLLTTDAVLGANEGRREQGHWSAMRRACVD
jgi:hypothetical protein